MKEFDKKLLKNIEFLRKAKRQLLTSNNRRADDHLVQTTWKATIISKVAVNMN